MEKIEYTLIKDINNSFFKDYAGIEKAFYHPKDENILLIESEAWDELVDLFIEDEHREGNIEILYFEDSINTDNDFNANKFWKHNDLHYKTPDGFYEAFIENNFEILKCIDLKPGTEQAYLNNWKEKGKNK